MNLKDFEFNYNEPICFQIIELQIMASIIFHLAKLMKIDKIIEGVI